MTTGLHVPQIAHTSSGTRSQSDRLGSCPLTGRLLITFRRLGSDRLLPTDRLFIGSCSVTCSVTCSCLSAHNFCTSKASISICTFAPVRRLLMPLCLCSHTGVVKKQNLHSLLPSYIPSFPLIELNCFNSHL
jgi:hypothetical protein